MTRWGNFEKNWLRPFLFFGNNPLSLIGGAVTTASALVLIGFWIVDIFGHGGSGNPYLGILFDLCLPALFVLGLLLIPLGIWLRHRYLRKLDRLPPAYPKIDFADPVFRRGIDFVAIATFINFVIVGTASYRGVAYMDTVSFCGQACHVMAPEWGAYHVSAHSGVACTECHIARGVPGYVNAKVNGSMQLLMVVFHRYPTPILAGNKVPPASSTCINCHNLYNMTGDKLTVKTSYGDDEKNSISRTLVLMHVGGRNRLSQASGIHGAHLARIEYISTDSTKQTILAVSKTEADGSVTQFTSSDAKGAITGEKHEMDCIDCHNRAAHSFTTPEEALNKYISQGTPSQSLPFVHKQALALLKADYASQEEAEIKIADGLSRFYRTQYPAVWSGQREQVEQAARALVSIYRQNVFPFMKVTWGSHPNNLGHNDYPGCFRCHDGNHNAKNGKSIANDCAVCHNLIAVDEPNPKILAELGMQ